MREKRLTVDAATSSKRQRLTTVATGRGAVSKGPSGASLTSSAANLRMSSQFQRSYFSNG